MFGYGKSPHATGGQECRQGQTCDASTDNEDIRINVMKILSPSVLWNAGLVPVTMSIIVV